MISDVSDDESLPEQEIEKLKQRIADEEREITELHQELVNYRRGRE